MFKKSDGESNILCRVLSIFLEEFFEDVSTSVFGTAAE